MAKDDETEMIEEVVPIVNAISGQHGAEIRITQAGSTPNTEYFQIELEYSDRDGSQKEEAYFVKKFLKSKENGTMANFFQAKVGSVQKTENEILNRYKELGCKVPSSLVKVKEDILILERIKGEDLETKLLQNARNEDERSSLIEKTSSAIGNLHDAGRRIQGTIFTSGTTDGRSTVSILKSADLMKRADYYFVALAADADDLVGVKDKRNGTEELITKVKAKCNDNFHTFNCFFAGLSEHFSRQETQLIHGDTTTYHVIVDKEGEPWFIDFGKPKFSHVVFDLAPLYFSQDINLQLGRIENIFAEYLKQESINLTGRRELSSEIVDRELKSLYYGACFANIRRAAKNRFSRVVFPEEYKWFIDKHPSYADSMSYYKKSTKEIIEHLLKKGERFQIDPESRNSLSKFLAPLDQFLVSDSEHRYS